jgi:hypothetical protein
VARLVIAALVGQSGWTLSTVVGSPAPMRRKARCYLTRWWIPQNAQQKELQEWWLKKYGPPFPTFSFSVWDTPFNPAMGMKKAQSADPVKIADALHGALEWAVRA